MKYIFIPLGYLVQLILFAIHWLWLVVWHLKLPRIYGYREDWLSRKRPYIVWIWEGFGDYWKHRK